MIHDRSWTGAAPITRIDVLPPPLVAGSFAFINTEGRMTTGKRYMDRTKSRGTGRVLDARTRSVLQRIHQEPRGRALDAYLRAMGT